MNTIGLRVYIYVLKYKFCVTIFKRIHRICLCILAAYCATQFQEKFGFTKIDSLIYTLLGRNKKFAKEF